MNFNTNLPTQSNQPPVHPESYGAIDTHLLEYSYTVRYNRYHILGFDLYCAPHIIADSTLRILLQDNLELVISESTHNPTLDYICFEAYISNRDNLVKTKTHIGRSIDQCVVQCIHEYRNSTTAPTKVIQGVSAFMEAIAEASIRLTSEELSYLTHNLSVICTSPELTCANYVNTNPYIGINTPKREQYSNGSVVLTQKFIVSCPFILSGEARNALRNSFTQVLESSGDYLPTDSSTYIELFTDSLNVTINPSLAPNELTLVVSVLVYFD